MDKSWANVSEWCSAYCDPTTERWNLVKDMNRDGVFTISDVWHWLGYAFHAPGDGFIYLILTQFQDFAAFFEFSVASYGGFFSGVFSFAVLPIGIVFKFTDRGRAFLEE